MPELQVSVVLPYYLELTEGDYQTAQFGEVVQVIAALLQDETVPRTSVRAHFKPEDSTALEEIESRRVQCAKQLLRRINRLLRWYRSVSRRANITELTRAQVSPFKFEALETTPLAEWIEPLEYEAAGPQPAAHTLEQTTRSVRDGLASGMDPDVADLFLLDAERALHQGRFRETVLFCWSTIDSVFNRRFDDLVDVALAGEWGEGRDFFKGLDFKLRYKMSAGMYLFAKRSLFREPGELWQPLSASYTRRNAIIHRGENATEDDATQAIDVARRIVQIMREVQ
ncbi:MAG TPA: hypothetical protein VG097_04700 [Gemmata sp.]|jgi:hypothetical protein|nr:hypothetical protein [Gemmata sp.]